MQITADYGSGRLIIHLAGELDHHGAREGMEAIERVLDMSALTFMDSSGIALILKTDRRMRQCGGRASIANPAKQPLRVLDASGIERMIPVRGGSRQ